MTVSDFPNGTVPPAPPEDPPKPPEPPKMARFDSKMEANLKVKDFMSKMEALLKQEFGETPGAGNVLFNMNLIWDIEIKEGDKYMPSVYAVSTRPHNLENVDRLVDVLLSKDPVLVSAFIAVLSKVFFNMYMISMSADAVATNIASANAEEFPDEPDAENKNSKEKPYLRIVPRKPEDEIN